jgi:hypothetical protein
VSGVASALISAESDFTLVTQVPYTDTPTFFQWQAPEGTAEVYVRFVDHAGNVSDIISQSLAP